MWSLIKQLRIDGAFSAPVSRGGFLTVVVPSNTAWEKAQRDFSQAYTTLTKGEYPQYVSSKHCKLFLCLPFMICLLNNVLLREQIFNLFTKKLYTKRLLT